MTQLRRHVPPALVTLFATHTELEVADLYTIELTGGLVLRWTSWDSPVTLGADAWLLGPGLHREFLEFRTGVDTQETGFTVTDDGRTLVNGQKLLPFMLRGGFDGASVVIHQVYAPVGGAWVDKLERFTGSISPVETGGRGEVKVVARSVTEQLNQPLPPDVYEPQCRNDLYGPVCGLDRDDYLVLGSATGPTTALRLAVPHAMAGYADGYFDLGVINFYTGANAGVSRTVRQHTSGEIRLMQPLPAHVIAGDDFVIWPGCNLTREQCIHKFGNLIHFRGFPFIPPPETVL